MSSLAMAGVPDVFTSSEDSLARQQGYEESNDLLTSEVLSDEKFGTEAPSEVASPLESKYSGYSQTTGIESTSATQGSSAPLSGVVSASELGADENNFLAARMKKFIDTSRPGLAWSDKKFDLYLAAQHADQLVILLDSTLHRLLEAQRVLSGAKEAVKPKLKLLDDWTYVLLESISALGYLRKQWRNLKQHLSGKCQRVAADLDKLCTLLMAISLNIRTGERLLLDVIQKHSGKFDVKGQEISIEYQKLIRGTARFQCFPPLGAPKEIQKFSSSDIIFAVQSAPDGGLCFKDPGPVGPIKFSSFDHKLKLTILNDFFDEIRSNVLQSAYGILNKNATQILAPIRSTSKKFGKQMTLEVKPTSNGLEKHILQINAFLEDTDESYWDRTLGCVVIQFLMDIRQRMLQVINLTEWTSQALRGFEHNIEKIDNEIGHVLEGKLKGELKEGEQVSVNIVTSAGFADLIHTYYSSGEDQVTLNSINGDTDGVSEVSSKKDAEVKISISDLGMDAPCHTISRWGKFKRWFTWKKTDTV